MATGIYLKVTGNTQGEIEGSVEQAGREGTTEVLSFGHGISANVDFGSGRTIGKRTHAPISLSCKVGKATPLYLQALTNNERLKAVKIDFYHTDETGMEVLFYTIELENASFAYCPQDNTADFDSSMSSDGGGSFDVASYSLAYQKIIWTWADGNVQTEDDWLTPT